jgi:predicted nicotinamide N-methyase
MSTPKECNDPETCEGCEGCEDGVFKFVSVTIPEGLKPGDSFTFKINDDDEEEMEMIVPDDAKPGETIEVLVAGEDDEDIIDDISVSVALHPSVNATITCSPFLLDALDEEGAEVKEGAEEEEEDDDDEEDGTNMMAWPAGVYLSQFLSTPSAKPIIENKTRALELGSGLGVGGLGLIAAFNRDSESGNKREVVLTDTPAAETLLKANVEVNKGRVVTNDSVDVKVANLTWGNEEDITALGEKFDLIIGSDLLFETSEEGIKNLTSTMTSLLKEDSGLVVFSTRWRKADGERAFFETMEKSGYEFILASDYLSKVGAAPISEEEKKEEEVVVEIFENKLSWKEFGSDASEESKKYLTETKVDVAGTMMSLQDITEDHIDEMEEEHFDEYEMRYVQIYVGYKA